MEKKNGSLKSTMAVSLTNYLDAGAIVAAGSGLSLWQDYLSLQEVHLGWLNAISANTMGAAVGAIIGGYLADKYGRKFIYTYNMLIYMLGVLIITLSCNFPMLLAGFLVTGISVGVGVPASWTYISESSETNNRGRNIAISQMAWGIGPMIILLLGILLAPQSAHGDSGVCFGFVETVANVVTGGSATGAELNVFTSRIVFASLFVVALIAWILQRQLDESAEWKAAQEAAKTQPQKSVSLIDSFGTLLSNKVNVRTILFLAGIYLAWNMVSSTMGFFQQHIYETEGSVSNMMSNLLTEGQWVGIIVVTFIFSRLVDRVNQRWLYCFGVAVGVVAWLMVIMFGISGMDGLIVFTVLWAIQAGVSVQSFYALWASELFPAKYRAAAQGIMFFLVRGLSAVWGIVFVLIEDFTLKAYIMMALLLVSTLVGTIWTPKTQGKTLDQITRERYGDNV